MRPTAEQRAEMTSFRERMAAVAPRVRVTRDAEGWPMVPGRLGQIEWGGDRARLFVFTDRPRLIARLAAIAGVRHHQTGDREARFWFPADDADCLRVVCRVIRVRIRRPPTSGNLAALTAARVRGQ